MICHSHRDGSWSRHWCGVGATRRSASVLSIATGGRESHRDAIRASSRFRSASSFELGPAIPTFGYPSNFILGTTKHTHTAAMVPGRFCFDEEVFSAEPFDAAEFLEDCRARWPMGTIDEDLRQFQKALENQLVAIINEDYTEFLQLSSKLKGVDEAVSSVRAPILAVVERVEQVQKAMVRC